MQPEERRKQRRKGWRTVHKDQTRWERKTSGHLWCPSRATVVSGAEMLQEIRGLTRITDWSCHKRDALARETRPQIFSKSDSLDERDGSLPTSKEENRRGEKRA